jgi:hypothetical protein
VKSAEEIMSMLEAFDLTGSLRDAGELAGSPTTPGPLCRGPATPADCLRDYFRKGTNLTVHAAERPKQIQELNNRPRKALG